MDEPVARMRSVAFDEEGRERTARVAQELVGRHFAPGAAGDVIRGRMEHLLTR